MPYVPYQGSGGASRPNNNGRVAAQMLAEYFMGGKTKTADAPAQSTLKSGQGPLSEQAAKAASETSWMTRLESPKIGQTWNPQNQYLNQLANANSPANRQQGNSY